MGVAEQRVVAEPGFFGALDEALGHVGHRLARPVRQANDHRLQIFRAGEFCEFRLAPMPAAADQRHFLGGQAEFGEFLHQQLVVAGIGGLQQHEVGLAAAQFLHDRRGVRERRGEDFVGHQRQFLILNDMLADRLVEADG